MRCSFHTHMDVRFACLVSRVCARDAEEEGDVILNVIDWTGSVCCFTCARILEAHMYAYATLELIERNRSD